MEMRFSFFYFFFLTFFFSSSYLLNFQAVRSSREREIHDTCSIPGGRLRSWNNLILKISCIWTFYIWISPAFLSNPTWLLFFPFSSQMQLVFLVRENWSKCPYVASSLLMFPLCSSGECEMSDEHFPPFV